MRSLVLLRGINVGGRHPVAMSDLRSLFLQELGCTEVATYIQSGNLVCTLPVAGLNAQATAKALEQRFGFPIPVQVRSQEELRQLTDDNPFSERFPTEHLHCVFWASRPEAALHAALMAKASGDEQVAAGARELYLYLPHGAGRSKLALAVTAPSVKGSPTMRNWKTVRLLGAMLDAMD